MSSSFIVSNDDGFYILSVETRLWKKLDCVNLCTCMCVYLLQPLIKKAMRNLKQTSLFSLHTPGLLFFPWFLFSPSNYSDAITQISSWEHSTQKTFFRTRCGDKCHWDLARYCLRKEKKIQDLGSPLCSLQLQDPPNRWFFIYLAFVDHSLIAA